MQIALSYRFSLPCIHHVLCNFTCAYTATWPLSGRTMLLGTSTTTPQSNERTNDGSVASNVWVVDHYPLERKNETRTNDDVTTDVEGNYEYNKNKAIFRRIRVMSNTQRFSTTSKSSTTTIPSFSSSSTAFTLPLSSTLTTPSSTKLTASPSSPNDKLLSSPSDIWDSDDNNGWQDMPIVHTDKLRIGLDEEERRTYHHRVNEEAGSSKLEREGMKEEGEEGTL
ncbi:hypothetical protein C8J55DRAFT_291957 [Lentinula edodes]|uniref:Uncharacterized protein n=1 Tax=Lentinula lateritia TaxID=40482 RepID=A0A9W8ZRG3_9AGAR|nr:hypothetical protein C8J55DRAFT_291957 [Lentinula edodes]